MASRTAPDYAQSVCLSLSVPCAGHGAAAHEGRSIHDAVIHRLRAVHGELQRLLALHKLLRLLNRLRAEGTARLMASKGGGGRVGSAPPWRRPADCLSARTRRQGAIINEQRLSYQLSTVHDTRSVLSECVAESQSQRGVRGRWHISQPVRFSSSCRGARKVANEMFKSSKVRSI